MAIANLSSTVAIKDGGLAIVSSDAIGLTVLIGTCSAGSAGTFYSFAGSATAEVESSLGQGPLAAQTIKHLLKSGGKRVIAYKAAASTAGSSSAVTQSPVSGPAVTLSGAPYDRYDAIVKIITGGTLTNATFQYSLDGGDNWSDTIVTAASYLLPSGVTVTFPAGTYVANVTYSWTDTAPAFTSADIGTALDAVITSAYDPELVHVLSAPALASDSLTIATLIATKIASAWAAHKYFRVVFEAPAVDKASIASTFAAFTEKGLVGCGGYAEIVEDQTNLTQKRSSARCIVPRMARAPLGTQPTRDTADSDLEALSDVVKLVPDGAAASTGYHDEDATPAFSAARFSSLRKFVGRQGYYIANVLTLAGSSSDFQQDAYIRILLAATREWYAYTLTQLGRRIRIDKKTGYIKPSFADAIERAGRARILNALGDAVEDVKVLVNRTDRVASTQKLIAKVRVVVGGYAQEFESEIGLADSL